MKNDKVLLSGGAGFIGSNHVSYLLENTNSEVLVLDKLTYAGNLANLDAVKDNSRYTFVKGDICDESLLKQLFEEHKFDQVIHFAAESHVDNSITGPAAFIETNIVGTFLLLQQAYKTWMNGPGELKEEFKQPDHQRSKA